jgi:putative ABC transport system substrate-binding protein
MKRRHFVLAAGATAAASPARSQAPSRPRIAYLSGRSRSTDSHLLEAFRGGLKSTGYVDGQNVTMDIRWADGRYGDVVKMAEAMVATAPDLIVAVGGNPVGLAAKRATSTIPVVFGAGADPAKIGLVANLNRPEGNLTGMTLWANELDAKRLDLLHDMLPKARKVAVLMNPDNPGNDEILPRTREAAAALGLEIQLLTATGTSAIERAFLSLPAGSVDALAVGADAFLINSRARILALTSERKLPAIFPAREFAVDGGLASYGTNWADMYRILGTYTGRLLKGAKPIDLPVQRPNTFELVVNLKTARMLHLDMPPLILTRADEVIE